ncbi:MAG: MBL fold metallo-hydrolase [Anaerolineae bacterium]|jgi:7,8-dihydropterin-6-yl-methyl-4-(beta-D-ribofuranosyl)aminobenzene 5'-phosphate synthase|nr:MBL fold metallo-hydrolase [Anaerolineae bacterium]
MKGAFRISILVDNSTLIDQYYIGEPGFSAFLEADGMKILFDTGYSDAFLKNARMMNIDPLSAEFIILSHGHLDHTWGLLPMMREITERDFKRAADAPKPFRQKLIAHPAAFARKMVPAKDQEIGNVASMDSLQKVFDVRMIKTPLQLSEHVLYLGEIPRETSFEPAYALGTTEDGSPDYLLDDTALAITTNEGLVILTGCSHAGICNIVQYAMELTGETRLRDIVGGFHLLDPSEARLNGTVAFLKERNPLALHACHCTDLRSKVALGTAAPIHDVGSGMMLEYD